MKSVSDHFISLYALGLISVADCVATQIVLPSAGAWATSWAAMFPLAPGLLSTITIRASVLLM